MLRVRLSFRTKAAVDALAQSDAEIWEYPNLSAADVQREVTGRPVNFDTLEMIYKLYLVQFEGHLSEKGEQKNDVKTNGHRPT